MGRTTKLISPSCQQCGPKHGCRNEFRSIRSHRGPRSRRHHTTCCRTPFVLARIFTRTAHRGFRRRLGPGLRIIFRQVSERLGAHGNRAWCKCIARILGMIHTHEHIFRNRKAIRQQGPNIIEKFIGTLITIFGIELQSTHQNRIDFRRYPGRNIANGRRMRHANRHDHFANSSWIPVFLGRRPPRQQFVKGYAERPKIGSKINLPAPSRLFWRHEERRSQQCSGSSKSASFIRGIQ